MGEFSTFQEVYDDFLQKYDDAIDYYIYYEIEPSFFMALLEIVGMIICVKLVDYTDKKE